MTALLQGVIAVLIGWDFATAAFKTGHEHKPLSHRERVELAIAVSALLLLIVWSLVDG